MGRQYKNPVILTESKILRNKLAENLKYMYIF